MLLFLIVVPVLFAQRPNLSLINVRRLELARDSYRAGSADVTPIVEALTRNADKTLRLEPVTVMMKRQIPPSGDKHDYMSLAPYWWPDPKSKDGLPYIRRDGETNPEREEYSDRANFGKMQSSVFTLCLAYYFTGREKYAAGADKWITAWFLDPATRMNPNMNFAEAVRGRNDGRGSGIIEIHMLSNMLDGVLLLKGAPGWPAERQKAMSEWCRVYYDWLTTSKQGLDEQNAPNNHGSWYDVQRVSLASFLGMKDTVIRILKESRHRRIASQIEPDGRQPKELERTRAMGYSTFNLQALTFLAIAGSNNGVDLWNISLEGRSIKKAIDWMLPFYLGEKRWEYKQISEFKSQEAFEVLIRAGAYLGKEYYDAAMSVAPKDREKNQTFLMY